MAQSFNAISVSLGEAERETGGKTWTQKDYDKHKKGFNISPRKSFLNDKIISVDGKSERDVVNEFFLEKMEKINDQQEQKVDTWNASHFGKTNPKTGKPYKKKSLDKRNVFPVGKYESKGKRQLPYDTLKHAIEKGNVRGKEGTTRYRSSVLQQYVVGFGSEKEWKEGTRKEILKQLNSDDTTALKARNEFEENFVKPWLERFQKENPSMRVVQAVAHYDESHPHLQLTVLPYVDNEKNSGLGSTAYSGAIMHDHPNYNKQDCVGEWYRHEHEATREIIKSSNFNGQKLTLDAIRPGSHQSTRVDVHNRMQADLDKQKAYIDQQEANTKDACVEGIKGLDPDHLVPSEKLSKNEKPEKVSTPEGEAQHKKQPLSWLSGVLRNAQRIALQRINELKQQEKDRIQEGINKGILDKLWQQELKKTDVKGIAEKMKKGAYSNYTEQKEKNDGLKR